MGAAAPRTRMSAAAVSRLHEVVAADAPGEGAADVPAWSAGAVLKMRVPRGPVAAAATWPARPAARVDVAAAAYPAVLGVEVVSAAAPGSAAAVRPAHDSCQLIAVVGVVAVCAGRGSSTWIRATPSVVEVVIDGFVRWRTMRTRPIFTAAECLLFVMINVAEAEGRKVVVVAESS